MKTLRQVPVPDDLHHIPDHRHSPIETNIYRVHALRVAYKQRTTKIFIW